MMKTKKIVGALVLAAGLATTGLVGFAQQQDAAQEQNGQQRGERQWKRGEGKERHGMRGGFGPFARDLNLTDAQKEQMKQIATRYHESNKALRQQLRAQRGSEMSSFTDGTFNEAAVRAAAQARANAQVEMEVSHARMMSEMYAVLTPEQKAQLAQQREQWKQKRNEWRERRNANPGQKQ